MKRSLKLIMDSSPLTKKIQGNRNKDNTCYNLCADHQSKQLLKDNIDLFGDFKDKKTS